MHNREQGEVVIELDRPRTLRLTYNALAAFEKEMGRPWDLSIQQILDSIPIKGRRRQLPTVGVREIRALLWAALLEDDPRLTVEDTGQLMAMGKGATMAEQVNWIIWYLVEAWAHIQPPAAKKNLLELVEKIRAVSPGSSSRSWPSRPGSSPGSSGDSPPGSSPSTSMDSPVVNVQNAPNGQMR